MKRMIGFLNEMSGFVSVCVVLASAANCNDVVHIPRKAESNGCDAFEARGTCARPRLRRDCIQSARDES